MHAHTPRALLSLVVTALILQNGSSLPSFEGEGHQIELSAIPSCNVRDIRHTEHETVTQCFPQQDAHGLIKDEGECVISKNVDGVGTPEGRDTTYKKVCRHGLWQNEGLGDKKTRKKRWFEWFRTSVILSCPHICEAGGAAGEVVRSPPSFSNPCRPSDLHATFYTESGQSTTMVTWSDPSPQDTDGTITSLIQSEGSPSGSLFTGLTGSGYEHRITYTATDDDGLNATCHFSFVVIIPTCSAAVWPDNGQMSCSLGTRLGSVCTYSCNSGYQLTGSTQVTCQGSSSPSWTTAPTCEKVTCASSPPSVTYGTTTCTGSPYEYKSICLISCDIGYTLTGTDYTQCQADGSWSTLASTSCSVSDSAPPELSCLSPQTFYTDRHSTSVSVSWAIPTAIDSTDPSPTVTQTDGQAYGSLFQTGTSNVTYKATDSSGVESQECTIEIRVIETTCTDPAETLTSAHLTFSCTSETFTYGTECTLACDPAYPSIGTDRIICERNDSSNQATGYLSWGDGIMPSCNDSDCPALEHPAHGSNNPGYIGTSKVYTMVCDDNYTIPHLTGFTGTFICRTTGGIYNPDIAVPDCVAKRTVDVIKVPGEIYYDNGACSDTTTQAQLLSTLQQILDVSVNPHIQAACPTVNNCTVMDLTARCTALSGRRKRSTVQNWRDDRLYDISNREKRQTNPTLIVDFFIYGYLDQTIAALDALTAAESALLNIAKPQIDALVNNGTFDLDTFTLESDAFQAAQFGDIDCIVEGHTLNAITCAPCPPMYFHNTASDQCELCPIGTYSSQSGTTTCTACPTGYTTLSTGSRNESNCYELCPAGKYSTTGTVPCTSCPAGYYQSGTGQTSCTKCTTGTTEFTGSVSSTACQAFQLFINLTDGAVSAGALSSDMTHITLLFWIKPYASTGTDAYVKLTSGGNDRIIVSITSTIRVEMPGTAFNKTIGTLSSTAWTHLAVTWDTVNNDVLAFLNGPLHSSETFVTPPSSPLVSGGTIEIQSSGSSGIYIADLHLEDAVLSPTEISTMLGSCWTERSGDLFSLDDFRDVNLQGVAIQTPTSCDPINECDPNPCNNHTCVDGVNTYTCYCSGGWSGTNCTTPPDYCASNACTNGATCLSGNTGYTCTCVAGYSGDLCDITPADGGWSEWSEWTSCSATCSGTQTRTRSCDSPTSGTNGADCSGSTTDSQSCNQDVCSACASIKRSTRVVENCVTDGATGTQTCKVNCADGYALPDNLANYEFSCGVTTGYTRIPMDNPPDCVEPAKPSSLQLTTQIRYATTVSASEMTDVKQAIANNLSTALACLISGTCSSNVDITDSKRKRSTGSRITVTLTLPMTDTGALDTLNYIATASASTSFQELIDAINNLENSASYINISSSSIFDVTVNGVTYTSSQSTLTITGNVTCPSGQAATDGVCASCPAGTYYTSGYCTFCQKGTYSSSIGQTSCTTCPSGLSTTTIGSYAASQCTVDTTTTTTAATDTGSQAPNVHTTKSTSDHTLLFVGVGLFSLAIAIVLGVGACICFKKKTKKNRRINSARNDQSRPPYRTREASCVTVTDIETNTGEHAFINPTYDGRVDFVRTDNHGGRRLRNRDIMAPKSVNLPPSDHKDDIDLVRPSVSPPPPYSRNDDLVLPSKAPG